MSDETSWNPLSIGGDVLVDGSRYTLLRYIDLYSVLALKAESGERVRLQVSAILDAGRESAINEEGAQQSSEFELLSAEDWGIAQTRAARLAPLLADPPAPRVEAERISRAGC